MAASISRVLSSRACRTLERIGDLMVPAVEGFPSFSELGCIEQVDTIIVNAPPDDAKSLNLLLTLLSFAPTGVLRFLVRNMAHPDGWPDAIATVFRLMDMGIRGVIMGLYYSGARGKDFRGKTPEEVMEFELNRVPRTSLSRAAK